MGVDEKVFFSVYIYGGFPESGLYHNLHRIAKIVRLNSMGAEHLQNLVFGVVGGLERQILVLGREASSEFRDSGCPSLRSSLFLHASALSIALLPSIQLPRLVMQISLNADYGFSSALHLASNQPCSWQKLNGA